MARKWSRRKIATKKIINNLGEKKQLASYLLALENAKQRNHEELEKSGKLVASTQISSPLEFESVVEEMTEDELDEFIEESDFMNIDGLSYEQSAIAKGLYNKIAELTMLNNISSYEQGLKLLLTGVSEIIQQLKENPGLDQYQTSTIDKIKNARHHWAKYGIEELAADAVIKYVPESLHRDIDFMWDGIAGWKC